MKRFFPVSLLRQVGNFLHTNEKLLLALLAVVIVMSGSLWYKQYFNIANGGPSAGGTYVDGIVGDSVDLELIAVKLTKSGLFTFDNEGRVANHLIESWEVNADKTRYTFDLLEGISSQEIIDQLDASQELFGPAIISDQGDGVISVDLAVANPNIPLLFTQPIFDYGPYKLSKLSDTTAIFTRNNKEHALIPYINKIVIHVFSKEELLLNSLAKGKIDGARLLTVDKVDGYETVIYNSPSYYSVILNVNKSPFRDKAYRNMLVTGQAVSAGKVTLTVADEEELVVVARQIKDSWESQGLTVNIEIKSVDEISSEIGPTRDFQALLTGISYGPELDPFYLWHSSQIRPPGNNLSGIKDDTVDKLITQIESEFSIIERYKKIDGLHNYLAKQGVVQIISPVTRQFVVNADVVVSRPYIPLSDIDRWQAIHQWYIK